MTEKKSRRGGPGVKRPAGPGAPPRKIIIRAGDQIGVAVRNGTALVNLGEGVASVSRDGDLRVMSVRLSDGTTIIISEVQ